MKRSILESIYHAVISVFPKEEAKAKEVVGIVAHSNLADLYKKILEAMPSDEWVTARAIEESINSGEEALSGYLHRLVLDGFIEKRSVNQRRNEYRKL